MMQRHLAQARETTVKSRSDLTWALGEHAVEYRSAAMNQITLHEEGRLTVGDEEFPYTDGVHEQLLKHARIPLSFDREIRFETFNRLFDDIKTERSKGITLCISDGKVVGVGPALYAERVAKTSDLLDLLDLDSGGWEFESATISDNGVKINLLIPGAQVEPEEGDIVFVGMELSNSETGGADMKSELFTLRQVCTNGMTASERSTIYRSRFKKQSYASGLRSFAKAINENKPVVEKQAQSLYESITEKSLTDTELVSLLRTLQRRVGRRMNVNEIIGIDPDERTEIQTRVRTRDPGLPSSLTRFRTWDVHNAITATAREQQLLLRQALEDLGGKLLVTASQRRPSLPNEPFSLN